MLPLPVFCFEPKYVLAAMADEIKNFEGIEEHGIKLSDSTLETIEKFCVFRGQTTPFPINFSMSNMECSQLYELLFNSEIIYLHPDCHAMNCEFYPF